MLTMMGHLKFGSVGFPLGMLCAKRKDVPHSGRSGELNYIVKDWQKTTVRIVTYSAFISSGGKTRNLARNMDI